jgi:hypothetical protein
LGKITALLRLLKRPLLFWQQKGAGQEVPLIQQRILYRLTLSIFLEQIIECFDCQGVKGGVIFDGQHFQGAPALYIYAD